MQEGERLPGGQRAAGPGRSPLPLPCGARSAGRAFGPQGTTQKRLVASPGHGRPSISPFPSLPSSWDGCWGPPLAAPVCLATSWEPTPGFCLLGCFHLRVLFLHSHCDHRAAGLCLHPCGILLHPAVQSRGTHITAVPVVLSAPGNGGSRGGPEWGTRLGPCPRWWSWPSVGRAGGNQEARRRGG